MINDQCTVSNKWEEWNIDTTENDIFYDCCFKFSCLAQAIRWLYFNE